MLAERGSEASVAEVARRAGVGTATIFRRFPHKDDLIAAVVEQRVRELVEGAARAAAHRDPRLALHRFMEAAANAYIHDRCFCDAAATSPFAQEGVRELVDELTGHIGRLLERAKAAGAVREDVTATDIPVLLMAVAQAGLALERAAPGAWKRTLGIVLDGLRPEAARPLARRPLTGREFESLRHC